MINDGACDGDRYTTPRGSPRFAWPKASIAKGKSASITPMDDRAKQGSEWRKVMDSAEDLRRLQISPTADLVDGNTAVSTRGGAIRSGARSRPSSK